VYVSAAADKLLHDRVAAFIHGTEHPAH